MTAPFTIPIPTYQCHKRVQALRIKAVILNPRGYELHFEDERFCPIEVSEEFRFSTGAEAGCYFVVYEDGFRGCIPAATFEAGYTLVETADGAVRSPDWPKLDKPAMVGVGRFGVGVSTRLVVEAAQRRYADNVTPEKDAERIARAQDAVAKVRAMLAETDAARVLAAAMDILRQVPDEFAPPDHPIWAQAREIIGDNDGPWAEGCDDRTGPVGPATQAAVAADLARYGIDAPGETHEVVDEAAEMRRAEWHAEMRADAFGHPHE